MANNIATEAVFAMKLTSNVTWKSERYVSDSWHWQVTRTVESLTQDTPG